MHQKSNRTYIDRVRNDPRTRAMMHGWVAQATAEADLHVDGYDNPRKLAAYAAQRAIELAMSYVLDNDGELTAVREQLNITLKHAIELANTTPRQFIVPTDQLATPV